jgi:fatty acid-binding protein DegV
MSKVAVVTDSTAYIPEEMMRWAAHLQPAPSGHLGRKGVP